MTTITFEENLEISKTHFKNLEEFKVFFTLNKKNNIESLIWSSEVIWTKDHNNFLDILRKA